MNLGDMLIESAKEAADLARARYGYDFDLGFQQIATALNSPLYRPLFEEIVQLRAALAERQWQPIETAPRDGTWVLIYVAYDCERPGFVTEAAYHPSGGWNVDPIAKITHWMPLPEPPCDEGKFQFSPGHQQSLEKLIDRLGTRQTTEDKE